jgi:hypothetical protein
MNKHDATKRYGGVEVYHVKMSIGRNVLFVLKAKYLVENKNENCEE